MIPAGIGLGFRFVQFTFVGFTIKNDAGKLSFLVAPARLTAETIVIKNDENGKDIIKLNIISTVLSVISGIVAAFVVYKINGMNTYVKSMFVCLLLVILLNVYVVYSMLKSAFGTGIDHEIWEHATVVKNRLACGARPSDCEKMEF